MSEEPIDPEWSAAILNRFLKRAYNYDLFDFALSVAVVLRKTHPLNDFNIWRLTKPTVIDLRTVQRERDKLVDLRDRLIVDLKEHLEVLSSIQNPLFPKEILPGIRLSGSLTAQSLERMVRSAYGIDATLTEEIGVLAAAISQFEISRGAPSRPSNLLGCLWSLIMSDQRRIHLENIENLLNWFYERIENTNYREELRGSPSLEEISRFMRRHRDELVEDSKKIFYFKWESGHPFKKIFPYSIRFDSDEPQFSKRRTIVGNIEHCLIFPLRRNDG